ncbi:phage head closure protein [Neopusillimonas maritima]|jgi:SPP1 family predicted phage head-tail adaptor|uniref:Head-tail adaptor protein n=1 Tax=Neopusillimonas maritima TaxID=2026239 RepID=A0ABX9MUW6_9BURK|nr:phage head closure protein [Neopusillimonas maritima]RII82737.1 hypothetical protein CJO09_09090 [Neopusillimonas maritima]
MKIGRLRHRLELQEQQEIQDPNTGAITKEWVALREVWASVEGVNGREFLAASAEQSATTWRITLHYQTVSPKWRIVWDGVVFNIKAILPNNNRSHRFNV